jgi:hypothetical protein
MPRKRNGPGVFLLSVGVSIALLGLMTLLAIPAAKELDLKEAVSEGVAPGNERQVSVIKGGAAGALIGGVLALTGWALVRKRR